LNGVKDVHLQLAVLPAARHQRQPWKNGLGVSLVIAGMPEGAGFDRLDWQISSTEIAADCPFSSLPGLERLFLVIGGSGVELSCTGEGVDRRERIDAGRGPFRFSGDWRTSCRLLDGPVRVLNVITRRGRFGAQLAVGNSVVLRKEPEETLVAVDLASLDAWLLRGRVTEARLPDSVPRHLALVRLAG
jgi:environmental stress-induced protein Ves